MRAFYWRRMGEPDRAETEFENALARQPRHELACAALAELYEHQDRLDCALEQYVALAAHASQRETTQLGLARVLRKLGRIDEARAVLQSLAARPEPSSGWRWRWARSSSSRTTAKKHGSGSSKRISIGPRMTRRCPPPPARCAGRPNHAGQARCAGSPPRRTAWSDCSICSPGSPSTRATEKPPRS